MADDPTAATLDVWEQISKGVDELAATVGDQQRAAELAPAEEGAADALEVAPEP